jgi:uncharacterized protein (TIGR01440 family)
VTIKSDVPAAMDKPSPAGHRRPAPAPADASEIASQAGQVLAAVSAVAARYQVHLAIQCCEHLNRALVVERRAQREHGLTRVSVWPRWNAGGSLASAAMEGFDEPVVVESVSAAAGMDIGHTLIGMHLRPVAVPVRLPWKRLGAADLVLARTRPRLIGGARACYSREEAAARDRAEADAAAAGGPVR